MAISMVPNVVMARPDSSVQRSAGDIAGSSQFLESLIDRSGTPGNAKERAQAVARVFEAIAYCVLSEAYYGEIARLEKQSLTPAIDSLRSKYGRISREIKTLYGAIPHHAIEDLPAHELNSIMISDSLDKLIVLKRYLGLPIEDTSDEYLKHLVQPPGDNTAGSAAVMRTLATLYTEMGALKGPVYHFEGERLSDVLNGMPNVVNRRGSPFLEFSDALDQNREKHDHNLRPARIEKKLIQMVTLSERDAARGAGSGHGSRSPAFVPKRRVPVELKTADYTLSGSIHCSPGQTPEDVFGDSFEFLSLTDVAVRPLGERFEFSIPYAAVNKRTVQARSRQRRASGDGPCPP